MFNVAGLSKGLTLTKIIGGISKTLQIANQVIPLYQKAKPMIQNARSVMGVLKEFKTTSPKAITTKENKVINKKYSSNGTKKEEIASPTFFL